MDLQLAVLAAALREGGAGLDALNAHGINASNLFGDSKKVYEFILEHNEKYQEIPSLSVIYNKLDITIPEVHESLSFFIDEFKNVKLYNHLQDGLFKAANEQQFSKDPQKTLELLESIVLEGNSLSTGDSGLEDMSDIGLSAMGLYERFERNESGITTPWEGLNKVSSGFWGQDLIVYAARNGLGKCIAHSTLIQDPVNGLLHTIQDVYNNKNIMTVPTWSKNHGVHSMLITDKVDTGYKKCLQFTLRTGKNIVVTPEHPFLTEEGWKKAEELSIGSIIGTPARMPFPSEPITKSKDEILSEAISCADFNTSYIQNQCEFMLPDFVFSLCENDLKLFLFKFLSKSVASVFDSICFLFCSRKISMQVQHLLLRFGIQSEILQMYEGSSSELKICNPFIFKFISDFSSTLDAEGLEFLEAESSGLKINSTFDVFWDEIVEIKDAGVCKIYDLTVEPTHCFIANDIIVHNTWLMLLQAIYTVNVLKKKVIFVSPEMPRERLALRTGAIIARLDYNKVLTGKLSPDDKLKLRNAIMMSSADRRWGIVSSKKFDFKTNSLVNLVKKHKPDVVYIDGMYLLQSEGANRFDQAAKTTDDLKKQAIHFEIPYVVSTQFNKEVDSTKEETVTGKGVALTDVLNWHASSMFGLFQTKEMKIARMLELIHLKGREGVGTPLKIWWDFEKMKFDEILFEKPPVKLTDFADDPFAQKSEIIDDRQADSNNSDYDYDEKEELPF